MAHLSQPIAFSKGRKSDELIKQILEHIWEIELPSRALTTQSLVEYYFSRVSYVDRAYLDPRTHNDVIDIVKYVKSGRLKTLTELRDELQKQNPKLSWLNQISDKAAQRAVEFGFRLWLRMEPTNWDETATLTDYVQSRFPGRSATANPNTTTPMDETGFQFCARSLDRVAGLKIVFTHDLSEHLKLSKGKGELKIFRHTKLLTEGNASVNGQVFPTVEDADFVMSREKVNFAEYLAK